MSMSSRKTIWLIVAVVALIFVQVGVLGFIVVRSVTAKIRSPSSVTIPFRLNR